MNAKQAKRLRQDARDIAKEVREKDVEVKDDGYRLMRNGMLVTHPATTKGVYKSLKKKAKEGTLP